MYFSYRQKQAHRDFTTPVTSLLFLIFLLAKTSSTGDNEICMGALAIIIRRPCLDDYPVMRVLI